MSYNAEMLCSTCWAFIAKLVITSIGQRSSALAAILALKEPTLYPFEQSSYRPGTGDVHHHLAEQLRGGWGPCRDDALCSWPVRLLASRSDNIRDSLSSP